MTYSPPKSRYKGSGKPLVGENIDEHMRRLRGIRARNTRDGRRLTLRKALVDMNMVTYDPSESSRSDSVGSELHEKNRSNLIVSYLPSNTTQDDLWCLFSETGAIESCKPFRERSTGESLGYAFVKYSNARDASKAIETYNGMRPENKTTKVSIARPSCEGIKGANLYICGLPKTLKPNELEKIFKSCGRIITTRILYDKETSLSRGIAFIRYDKLSEAERAITHLDGYKFPETNDVMTVKFANSPNCYFSVSTSAGYRRRKKVCPPPMTQKSKCRDSSANQSNSSSIFSVKSQQFCNLERNQRANSYHNRFVPQYSNEINTPPSFSIDRLLRNSQWQQTHLNMCQLTSLSCMQNLILPSKFKKHTEVSPVPILGIIPLCKTQLPHKMETPDSMRALLTTAYAANAGALKSEGWNIFVQNLSADVDNGVLWQLFGPFGAVHTVNAAIDPNTKKCKGYGFVTMLNYDEAVKAIKALSGYILGNRMLQVSFRTKNNPLNPRFCAVRKGNSIS